MTPTGEEINSREELIAALVDAAELEHIICCQYLFAAFSLKTGPDEGLDVLALDRVRDWKSRLLMIARQEMVHLSVICNLLTSIGGAPHFTRLNFPLRSRHYPINLRFELRAFRLEVLDQFIEFEKPHPRDCPPEQAEAPQEQAPRFDTDGADIDYISVSELYAKIDAGLVRLGTDKPESLFLRFDGHFTNKTLEWPEGYVFHDMIFPIIRDLRSARAALHLVRSQGEGPLEKGGHHELLKKMRDELDAMRKAQGAGFEPARPVVDNPSTRGGGAARGTGLDAEPARELAALFNYANESMLMMLVRMYADADNTSPGFKLLRDTVLKSLMTMVLRPLGELLTELPARTQGEGRAGAPFEIDSPIQLIQNREVAWSVFRERFDNMVRWSQALCGVKGVPPRMRSIHNNLRQLNEVFSEKPDLGAKP